MGYAADVLRLAGMAAADDGRQPQQHPLQCQRLDEKGQHIPMCGLAVAAAVVGVKEVGSCHSSSGSLGK
jgi:hypothetical protein